MAEVSLLWETNNTGDGVAVGYTDDQMFQIFRSFCPSANIGGVASDVLNKLAVTGTSSPVAVNTGQALVYGIPYYNTASVTVAIATPAALTRIDRIVLRASWAAQTVRITRIAGTEGGAAPAMTQVAGTTWDIPLATVSITTGGVITVTDAREWVGAVGDATITATKLASNAVTTAKILDDNVTGAKIADYAIDPRAHISGTNGIVVDPQNGNARGTDAVDLQTLRSVATEVASGIQSVIGGGSSNTVTGQLGTVSGGTGNLASSTYAAIGGGGLNTASGQLSTVAGGSTNVASGDNSAVGGGEVNTASGPSSAISGGSSAIASKHGQEAHAAGQFAAQGDAQRSIYVLRNSTSNATPTALFLDGASLRLTIASDTTWAFRIIVVARRTDADNESAIYEFYGGIDNNAGTTALVGSVVATTPIEDTAAWAVAVTADNTNDALIITVTGEAAKTIRWVATVWTTEVTG
jgi:hypothetical protein